MSDFRFALPVRGFTAPTFPGLTPTARHRRRRAHRRVAMRLLVARTAVFAALIAAGCEVLDGEGADRG
jgi:hypothetical protein